MMYKWVELLPQVYWALFIGVKWAWMMKVVACMHGCFISSCNEVQNSFPMPQILEDMYQAIALLDFSPPSPHQTYLSHFPIHLDTQPLFYKT